MILNSNSFLELLLENIDIRRISRALCKKEINDLFLFRSSGVPQHVLLSLAERILVKFRGREYLLSEILEEDVSLNLQEKGVKNLHLDLSSKDVDYREFFPLGYGMTLYRKGDELYATLWR